MDNDEKEKNGNDFAAMRDVPNRWEDFDFERHIPYFLARTSNVVRAATTPAYLAALRNQAPLSVREFRVLIVVAKFGPISPAASADRTGMDRATVTRAIAGLKRQGLIETQKNALDRRGKYVVLTAEGAAICDRVFPMMKERGALLADVFSAGEEAEFRRMLNKLYERAMALIEEKRE